jgi:hypothetical protein
MDTVEEREVACLCRETHPHPSSAQLVSIPTEQTDSIANIGSSKYSEVTNTIANNTTIVLGNHLLPSAGRTRLLP